MLRSRQVIPLDCGIYRRANTPGVKRFDLLFEQVALQMGMHILRMGWGIIIDPAMMAAGETGDRIDARLKQGIAEVVGIEVAADAGDLFRGMEIEVDLPRPQREFAHYLSSKKRPFTWAQPIPSSNKTTKVMPEKYGTVNQRAA